MFFSIFLVNNARKNYGQDFHTAIKDPHKFEQEQSPVETAPVHPEQSPVETAPVIENVAQTFSITQDWLALRWITVHFKFLLQGLKDLDNKTILWMYILVERLDQPMLVLVHLEQSRQRYSSHLMCLPVQQLLRVCLLHYLIQVICVCGAGSVQGTISYNQCPAHVADSWPLT